MKIDKTIIADAGVFRCCLSSVAKTLIEVKIGDKSECKYCGEKFTLNKVEKDNVWEPDWYKNKK